MFLKKNANPLFEHQPYDFAIDWEEGTQSLFRPIYNLSHNELLALQKYIDKNLENGFIQHSKSLAGALILFVKKDGFLHICVNYCGLN
jgi:hypothetical protein